MPQGTTLGPLLFFLYINDLPDSSCKLKFQIFADDTNMFYASINPKELEVVINEGLGNVINYCAVYKLSINFEKTNYMLITSPMNKAHIYITICNIEQKTHIKYLGVYMDEYLQWDYQMKHICNKMAKEYGDYLQVKLLCFY